MPLFSGRARAYLSILPALLFGLTALAGCSKRASDRVPVYPTRGMVLFEGRPAAGALVQLHPLDPQQRLPFNPRARVEQDGSFELTTYDDRDGAPSGDYAVSVDWRRRNPDNETEDGVSLLPARYNRPDTSGLRARIEPLTQGANDLREIQLKK